MLLLRRAVLQLLVSGPNEEVSDALRGVTKEIFVFRDRSSGAEYVEECLLEYAAGVRPAEARRSAWRRFVGAAFGGSMEPALQFLATEARLTPAQRDELRRLLQEDDDE